MYFDEIAEDIARRVAADLAKIYRPSSSDETSAWKRNIVDVLAELFKDDADKASVKTLLRERASE